MQKLSFLNYCFLFFILFLVLIGFGYLNTFNNLDPDFGWHLKTGQLILERGVPKIDWYSFTMPDFPWIDHSWLSDVLIYKIYSISQKGVINFSNFGIQILLLIFLGISALSFIILIEPGSFLLYLLPIILGFWSILGFLGIRPQIITAFFIAILWKILIGFLGDKNFGEKLIYFVPILFFIWVNLHGGFFAGLFILFLILILEIFKKTSLFKKIISLPFFQGQNYKEISSKKILILFIILIFSFLATFINPYGIRIYEEVFRTIGDPFLRFHIIEWLPLFFGPPFPVFIFLYLSLFLGLLIPLRKNIDFSKLVLIAVFLIFSFLNQRHFVIFVILSIPVFAEILSLLKKEISPEAIKILFSGFRKWLFLFFVSVLLIYGFYPLIKGVSSKDPLSFYPHQAISFLKTLPLSENLFNEYGWGGYLIWQLPERKLFIDGRMPSWRKDGQFVFGDYIKIMEAKEGFQELLDKYKIKIALLRRENPKINKTTETENKLSQFSMVKQWFLKVFGLAQETQQKNLYQELIKSGWQIIYEDEIAIILKR